MTKLEAIERQLEDLSPEELAEVRRHIEDLQADAWDRQIEADIKSGKLDAITKQALEDDRAGKSTPV